MSKCIMYCVNDDTYGNRAQKFSLRFNTFYSLNSDFDLLACIFKILQLSSADPDTSICFWYWWWLGGRGGGVLDDFVRRVFFFNTSLVTLESDRASLRFETDTLYPPFFIAFLQSRWTVFDFWVFL